jgi:hypothetical protein
VTAQKKAGKNAKSGEETKTLSHFSKSDIRYSSDVSPAKVIRVTGIADIPGSGVQGCNGFFAKSLIRESEAQLVADSEAAWIRASSEPEN